MVLEWDEWDELILRLDVQDALRELDEADQQFVSVLLETGSLHKVARELRLKLSEAQHRWEMIRSRLQQRLQGYGGS